MPDQPKKVPALEEFKAPWELDSDGNEIPEEDQEVDRGKLKKFLHNLMADKAKLQGKVATLTTERDGLQEKIDEKEREGESEVDRLKRRNQELEQKAAAADKVDVKTLRLEAALEAGLPRSYIKRLDPDLTDLDELIEDAKTLVADLNKGKQQETEDSDDDEDDTPRRRPKATVRTNGDPAGGSRKNEVSVDDLLNKVQPSSSVFR